MLAETTMDLIDGWSYKLLASTRYISRMDGLYNADASTGDDKYYSN